MPSRWLWTWGRPNYTGRRPVTRPTLDAGGRERRRKLTIGLEEQAGDAIPFRAGRRRVAQRRRLRAKKRRVGDDHRRRLVEQRVFVGDEAPHLRRAVLLRHAPRHPPRKLGARDRARIEGGA